MVWARSREMLYGCGKRPSRYAVVVRAGLRLHYYGKEYDRVGSGSARGKLCKVSDSRVALDQSENYSRATGQVPKITQFNA